MFKGYLVIFLGFGGVFWLFLRFRGCICLFRYRVCFGHFLYLWGHFGHFFDLWGYFGCIQVIEGILVFFRHGVLWLFSMFWGYVGQFLGFGGYFSHFLGFKGVLVFF